MTAIRQVIGRVGLALKGEWDSTASYDKLDVVEKDGSSYSSKVDGNTSVPGVSDTWQLLAEKGATGATGAKGDKGDKGDQGIQGVQGERGVQGYSSYQIAVQHGYEGTEEQYNALYFDAVSAANTAATNANTKAGLANDAATLANTKAGLANDAAALANEKAAAANDAATGAENVNAQLSGSVVTVTNRQGQSSSIDLLATTEELVLLTVTTDVEGVVVAGLPINVYYNGGSTPARTVELNAQGAAEIRVPINYEYRLVFPTVAGCKNIPDVVHTAVLAQRHIEVEYVAESSNTEHVMVTLKQRTTAEDEVLAGGYAVYMTTNGVTTTYYTNSSGVVEFFIPLGQTYEVSVPQREGWVTPSAVTLIASKSVRGISMVYRYVSSGVAVVDNTSQEYSLDDFLAAVQGGTKALSDAVAIRVSTDALVQNNGVILLSIDGLAKNQYSTGYQWCNQNVLFSSIPENGNSPTATYYYDGKSASESIQTEGDERSLQTPAVDFALGQTLSVGGVVHQGYLPSIGQWNVAWSNRAAIDDILAAVRPSDSGRLSSFTAAKWSSTQYNAGNAWYWTTVANSPNKSNSCAVVPFFAY
jgi:hypothetical protein